VTDIQTQYSTGASRQAIEQTLVAAGKDLDHLRQADLALLEDKCIIRLTRSPSLPILYVSGSGEDGDWLAPRTSASVGVLGVVSCCESSAVFSRQHPGGGFW
jgi:hypothetical protein